MMSRVDIIKSVTLCLRAKTYLEIGVNDGYTFLKIPVWKKIGVDPDFRIIKKTLLKYSIKNPSNLNNRYFSMTSDGFFLEKAAAVLKGKVDVAFIDGLHTFEQSLKDVKNTLPYLNENGVIIMHDCSPPDEASAYPAKSYKEAEGANIAGWTGNWCGDVWKTITFLRAESSDLNVFVLDCDYGVGFITKRNAEKNLTISKQEILKFSFKDLESNRDTLLNLKSPEYLNSFLETFKQ